MKEMESEVFLPTNPPMYRSRSPNTLSSSAITDVGLGCRQSRQRAMRKERGQKWCALESYNAKAVLAPSAPVFASLARHGSSSPTD